MTDEWPCTVRLNQRQGPFAAVRGDPDVLMLFDSHDLQGGIVLNHVDQDQADMDGVSIEEEVARLISHETIHAVFMRLFAYKVTRVPHPFRDERMLIREGLDAIQEGFDREWGCGHSLTRTGLVAPSWSRDSQSNRKRRLLRGL